jgi:eukaryotic-like serine/threonine-protein kinase
MHHKWPQAEVAFDHLVDSFQHIFGPAHPYTLDALNHRSYLYLREGKLALADADAAQVLAGDRHAFGSDHAFTMSIAARTAAVYLAEVKLRDAEALAREALAFYQNKQPDKWERFFAESILGAAMAGEKQYAEAEPPLLEGYRGMLAHQDRIDVPDRFYLERAHEWLVAFYRASGRPEKAAEWKSK